jgi:hypothetical protein
MAVPDFDMKTTLPPREGIFYDGQIFDAYLFASDLIKMATKKIILLDNYIDETVPACGYRSWLGQSLTASRQGRQPRLHWPVAREDRKH